MKKLKLIAFFCLIIMTSCSDSDKISVPDIESYFYGTWNVTEFYTTQGYFTTTINGQNIAAPVTINGENFDMTVVFNENPQTAYSTGSFIGAVTATIEGEDIEQDVTLDNLNLEGTWSVNNSILSVSSEDDSTTFNVISYSDTAIKLEYSVVNESLPYLGQNIIVTASGYVTFTR